MFETELTKIYSKRNPDAIMRILPGHFATNHSHINTYIDMTIMKARKSEALVVAKELASRYSVSNYIDTIICMDGCEVIGAYMADILTEQGVHSMNLHRTIYILGPEIHTGGQMIFRDNNQFMVKGKHVLLLLASATTGKTIAQAKECIEYYGGIVEGISAIFSAIDSVAGIPVNYVFSHHDLPNYASYPATRCPMCEQKKKLDGIVNAYGVSKL